VVDDRRLDVLVLLVAILHRETFWNLAANNVNQVTLVAAEAHVRIAANNANQVTLVAAGAHVRIILAMDRHQDDAKVQEMACRALVNLAEDNANQVTTWQPERTCASSARWTGTKTTRKCRSWPAARS
jgi:hypothetical protein